MTAAFTTIAGPAHFLNNGKMTACTFDEQKGNPNPTIKGEKNDS